jgi:hypothetical protein
MCFISLVCMHIVPFKYIMSPVESHVLKNKFKDKFLVPKQKSKYIMSPVESHVLKDKFKDKFLIPKQKSQVKFQVFYRQVSNQIPKLKRQLFSSTH